MHMTDVKHKATYDIKNEYPEIFFCKQLDVQTNKLSCIYNKELKFLINNYLILLDIVV